MIENKYKKMLEEHFENGYWEHHFSCSKASEENRECMLEIIKENRKVYDLVENHTLLFEEKIKMLNDIMEKVLGYGFYDCLTEWQKYSGIISEFLIIKDISKNAPHLNYSRSDLIDMEYNTLYGAVLSINIGLLKELYANMKGEWETISHNK